MAKVVSITCDLTGEPNATTHRITVDEKTVVIDLSKTAFDKILKQLDPVFAKGTVSVRNSNGVDAELAAVREWAGKNGHEVAAKGKIPQSVMDAYQAAHPDKQ